MSEPIKLKAEGDKHTMDVAKCRQLPFGKRPEIEFEGRDGSKVWVPKASADRQLARCNVTMESVVGRRVTLKREPSGDPAKPYWGIYLEDGERSGGTGGASNGAAATTQPAATTQSRPVTQRQVEQEKASAIYKRMTEWVLSDIVPLYANKGIPLDMQAIASITATLFINTQGRR